MDGRRKIPYGVMNWERIVRECHFVDNTAYIRKLEDVATPVFLRPKRFGKTMVCSMLAHYYDVNLKRRFRELFGKTEIGRRPTPLRNSFLVLTFDFSTITVGTLAEIERNFTENVRLAVGSFAARYAKFANWSKATKAEDAASMIDTLRGIAKNAGLPPIYVIIDEYDNFTNQLVTANRDADYDAVCGHDGATNAVFDSFFKTFFKSFKAGLADGSVGRTYFTGVLPITLDDLSSGFNVGTPVQLRKELLGLVGFTEGQVRSYVDEIFDEHALDPAMKPTVLADLRRLYDGYRFLPNAEPLYNATICNWYLQCLVSDREIPVTVTDSNVRTDVAWFRRLAQTNGRALEKMRKYVEAGEGEMVSLDALSAKFGRVKFFTDEFYPYALYYLGLLTFSDPYTLSVPNLTIKNMFVDYYDELSEFKNVDEARTAFIGAAKELCLNGGTWRNVFEQYWQHYVKARVPAQAYDKMNENFFRTTFTSRCLDAMTAFYSFETEYNTPEGRCDFLAVPKPGVDKPARLIEFKYFTRKEVEKKGGGGGRKAKTGRAASPVRRSLGVVGTRPPLLGRKKPDAETVRQAIQYRDALRRRPDWIQPIETTVIEVCGRSGYNWFDL